MTWLYILGLSVGLAMDAFAVSISAGLSIGGVSLAQVLRLSAAFGLSQFVMPLIGWVVGGNVAKAIGAFDHWIAFILLAFVGGKMLAEAVRGEQSQTKGDPTRGFTVVVLSVATSIDALAVGLSLGFLGVPILVPSAVIGIVAFSLTAFGIRFGSRIGRAWGRWAVAAGGCILVFIGIQILISHLTA